MPPVRVYLTAAANLKKADFNLGWHCASFLIWQIALLYNILGTIVFIISLVQCKVYAMK